MVSTFLSYRLYSADFAKSTARIASDAQVAREAQYYRDNIGKVKSVDDFLKNQRLYAYAMKANGLEDMTYAKAFMRKVLESDVSDQDSFVRKLVDQRYLAFAQEYNFATDGTVKKGSVTAQDAPDLEETTGLYSQQRVLKGAAAATEAESYKAWMGSITSVDQFLSEDSVFSYALTAYGLDPSIASTATIRKVLTSDLSDPQSFANQLGDARYQKLAAAFSFDANGNVPAGGKAQTTAQINDTIYLNYDVSGNGASPAAAAFKTQYYRDAIAGVTNVDDLVNNEKLLSFVVTAAGLDPVLTSPVTVRAVLTSDLSDPASIANSSAAYKTIAQAFNFNTDGTLDAGVAAQTADQIDSLVDPYLQNYDDKQISAETSETDYYKATIKSVTTVDQLLSNTRLYKYVLTAHGLDPTEESVSKIKQVLTSDVADSGSFARRLRDTRYVDLAQTFNFGKDGQALGPRRAQLSTPKFETIQAYVDQAGDLELDQQRAQTEADYYNTTIDTIASVDDFLKDKRLTTFALKAYGLGDETVTSQTLKQLLTSDAFDTKSAINASANARFREFATAFNFNADGSAGRAPVGQAQDPNEILKTADLYVRQTMEQRAGENNDGVRLALYFQRKAPNITSALSILADKALLQVTLTALGLPDSISQADIDQQAKMIERKLDVADFKDPKKLDKFLARFTALYDINNSSSQASIPQILLSSGDSSSTVGFSDSLLSSMQTLRFTV
jgi:hypothetical protein